MNDLYYLAQSLFLCNCEHAVDILVEAKFDNIIDRFVITTNDDDEQIVVYKDGVEFILRVAFEEVGL